MSRVHCAVLKVRNPSAVPCFTRNTGHPCAGGLGCAGGVGTSSQCYGGHGERETPGLIPNPEAKPFSADGTARGTGWESRTPPDITPRNGVTASAVAPFLHFRVQVHGRLARESLPLGTVLPVATPRDSMPLEYRAWSTVSSGVDPEGVPRPGPDGDRPRVREAVVTDQRRRSGGAVDAPTLSASQTFSSVSWPSDEVLVPVKSLRESVELKPLAPASLTTT